MMAMLKDRLLERGLITNDRLAEAVEITRRTHASLPSVLLERHMVREVDLLPVLGDIYGLEFIRLRDAAIEPLAVKTVSAKLAAHYAVMPIRLRGNLLTLAVADPLDVAASEDIETNLGLQVERVLACRPEIIEALRRHYGVGAETVERILAAAGNMPEEPSTAETSHDLEKMAEDTSVVKLVNQLLQEAIQNRATDIHFEVYRDGVILRRRIDGILYDASLHENIRLLYPAIISRIKLMSGLNIVERRMPQDGRARVSVGVESYDLRISIVPAIHGEDVVVRILPAAMVFDLGQLGFSDTQLRGLQKYAETPHGIIFVTGPTGSGKSTTLYACLSQLNSRVRKIITIEDPVEYEMRGITQTQVNPKIGLTFAHALRSMLRHDPDVMLVGEVRDRETAEIAIQTAMTGHLVLSSLHTNDAAGAAVRLMDMGIDPYLITSTVLVFTAQRLVRVLCPDCRESYMSDGKRLYRGRGCRTCNQSGYRGRMAISELLPLVPEIAALILARASASAIRAKANELGMATMAADGWEKVERGLTTAEEVLRVTTI
ncbi:MAG: GspE/PulE family protein [Lentisphaerae bacterium]|nr:GspE/PulE family protein [Lentisphaerota bacterium]